MSVDFKFDSLDIAAISRFAVEPSPNISSLPYDTTPLGIIDEYADGLILDCGAGFRDTYYENVVNYDIADYLSTDVIGVAEKLPFADSAFDAVFSFAVLEHVKFPFEAAAEICRVLKPGGRLAACVPFLQPLHGFPNHYFNMSHMGLKTLFEDNIQIERQFVNEGMTPIWTLTWILRSWADGLSGSTREMFLGKKIGELIGSAFDLWREDFVTSLSEAKNFELASATFLIGRKRS
jgi:SAM-dependent methyltransferase